MSMSRRQYTADETRMGHEPVSRRRRTRSVALTQETNDKKQLMPLVTTIERQSRDTPNELLADAGYCSDESLTAIAATTIDAYISTRKQKHGERLGPCRARSAAEKRDGRRRHAPEAAHEGRRGRLRGAQRARRTGHRTDQAGARLPAISAARFRERPRRMVVGVHHTQHSQVLSSLCMSWNLPSRVTAAWNATRPSPRSPPDRASAQHAAM